MDELRMEIILDEARQERILSDDEVAEEEIRRCGHMTDLAYSLLMGKEDEYNATWGRIGGYHDTL